jgi:predicted HAD superfamily hydrolase
LTESQPADWLDTLINGGVELLEFALMAPHGTTLGYELVNGDIRPMLESNAADVAVQVHAQQVQQGAMEFIDAVLPRIINIGSESLLSPEWARPFFRLVNDPTLEEATWLGDLTHSDSATDTSKRLHIAPRVCGDDLGAQGLWAARERAYWKRGFDMRNSAS